MTLIRKPLPRTRATPRTRLCQGCNERISSSVCPTCRTRKATKRGNIGKRCDALWSQIIKAPGRCERCGWQDGLQAAHIIGRAQRVVRWDVTNGICLCHDCHRKFDTYRIDRESLIVLTIGRSNYQSLVLKAQGVWSKQYPLAELTAALKNAKEKAV